MTSSCKMVNYLLEKYVTDYSIVEMDVEIC